MVVVSSSASLSLEESIAVLPTWANGESHSMSCCITAVEEGSEF